MKLCGSNPWSSYAISRVLKAVVFFSAEARGSSNSCKGDSLYNKINSGFRNPKIPITPVLDQWHKDGREPDPQELLKLIKQLPKYRRYSHALEIKDWMTDKMNLKLNPKGTAVKLDLIFKAHGLDKAEEYFNCISFSSRNVPIQAAMLNCYCERKSVEKANLLFKRMRELGSAKLAATSYNAMLTLYSRTGKHKELNSLVQEMEDKGVKFDSYTYNIQLNAYANSNVDAMEKFLSKMEGDSEVKVDCYAYFVAAKGFLKDGLSEKALTVLKKAEQLIKSSGNRTDYKQLITLFCMTGCKEEVSRIWDLYTEKKQATNNGYLAVLSSLLKLDDMNGAEKIFNEWERGTTSFDKRIVSLFISSYCNKGFLDKALTCAERFTDKGHKLGAAIWQGIATQCCVAGHMAKSVEMCKKVFLSGEPNWRLNHSTFAACLEYLKKEGNFDTAHEMVGLARGCGSLSGDICDRLVEFLKSDQESGALAVIGI